MSEVRSWLPTLLLPLLPRLRLLRDRQPEDMSNLPRAKGAKGVDDVMLSNRSGSWRLGICEADRPSIAFYFAGWASFRLWSMHTLFCIDANNRQSLASYHLANHHLDQNAIHIVHQAHVQPCYNTRGRHDFLVNSLERDRLLSPLFPSSKFGVVFRVTDDVSDLW